MADNTGPQFDQRERWNDPQEATRRAQEDHQSQIWTAMPVIIKKHDTDKNTAHVQIATKLKHVKADGTAEWKEFPLLKDVPINYHGGGGVSVTPPLADGDEGIIIFASRGIDKWWQSGGVQEQDNFRMHDISDGWLIPGGRSQPRKLKDVSKDTWQLRTDDSSQVVDFDPKTKKITITSPNPVTIKADLHVTGKVIAGWETDDQVALQSHTHAQPNDSHGDTEQETQKPTAGT